MAGRGGYIAPVSIVQEGLLLNDNDIRQESGKRFVTLVFQNNLEGIKWLAKRKLLRNSLMCQGCQVPMSFTQRTRLSDGYTWRCKDCYCLVSIRKDSFFAKSHLSLQQIIFIIYGWSRNYAHKDIAHEAGVAKASTQTMVDWCAFCRAICEQYLIDHATVIGGLNEDGTTNIVEIDESKFFHRKSAREEWQGHWVFGGIERGSGKCFLVEVPDRTAETLAHVIEKHIRPGTIIVSDARSAYNQISQICGGVYEHQVIGQEKHEGIHTQTIKNMWVHAKRTFRKHFGTSQGSLQSYLHEFVWRNDHKDSDIFCEFLICIREQYQF